MNAISVAIKIGEIYQLHDSMHDSAAKRPFQLTKHPNEILSTGSEECSLYSGDEFMLLAISEVEDSFFIQIISVGKDLVGWLYVCESYEYSSTSIAVTKVK